MHNELVLNQTPLSGNVTLALTSDTETVLGINITSLGGGGLYFNGSPITGGGGGGYVLPPATSSSLGGVIIPSSSGLTVDGSGNLSVNFGTGAHQAVAGSSVGAASGVASLTSSGYLPAAQFPVLSGDVSTAGGSLVTTLATVNSNVGTWTKVTVNSKGLVTAATSLTSSDITTALGFTPLSTSGGNMTGTLVIDPGASNSAIRLSDATSNWIDWGSAGLGVPAFSTRSVGTKAILSNTLSSTAVDFALGVSGSSSATRLWSSVAKASSGYGFDWYAGTTNIAAMDYTGNLKVGMGNYNYVQISGEPTGSAIIISAAGGDSNISIDLVPSGSGTVQASGYPVWTTNTLTNVSQLTNNVPYLTGAANLGTGSVTLYSALSGTTLEFDSLSFGTGFSTPTLTSGTWSINVNTGTGANQIVQLDGSARLPAVSGAQLTSLNASAIVSGTLGLNFLTLASGDLYVGNGSNNPAATAPSSLSLSAWGTPTANIALGAYTFTTSLTSFSTGMLVTYDYVNSLVYQLTAKAAVQAATTTNDSLTGLAARDGYTPSAGNRILVKNQTTSSQNGIYIAASGSWSRSSDMNSWTEVPGAFVFVENGTVNGNTSWITSAAASGTIGTTAMPWEQFAGSGTYLAGNGLTLTGSTFSVNTDGATTYIDGSSNVAVKSSTTQYQVLQSNGSGSASWGSVNLGSGSAVTGTLLAAQFPALTGDVTTTAGSLATTIASNAVTNAKFRQGVARSVVGVTGNATANVADIQGTANQVLVVNSGGTALAFGQVNLASSSAVTGTLLAAQFPALTGDVTTTAGSLATTISANAVTYDKFQQMTGLSVLGVTGSSTANAAAITGTSNQVLVVNSGGTSLGFGQVNLASTSAVTGTLLTAAFPALSGDVTNTAGSLATTISANAVTYAKFQQVAGLSVVGNSGSSTANTAAITGTASQLLAINSGGTSLGFVAPSTYSLSQWAAPTANISLGSYTFTTSLTSFSTGMLVTYDYVNSVAQGLAIKAECQAATTANITLSGTQTIDGYAAQVGDRILVKNQTTSSANGIYVVASGSWSRSADTSAWTDLPGSFTFILNGTTNGLTGWVCTVGQGGTIGTTAITFAQFSGAGTYTASATGGLSLSGTVFSANVDGSTTWINGSNQIAIKSSSTQYQVLVSAGSGSASWGQLNLGSSAAVTGTLLAAQFPALTGDVTTSAGSLATTIGSNAVTYAKFQQVTGLSVVGNAGSSTANAAAVTGTANQVLVVNSAGTALGFGQVNFGSSAAVTGVMLAAQHPALTGDVTNTAGSLATTISANAVTYAKFQQVAALSVVGNSGSSTANAVSITGTANQVLVVNSGGTALGFGQVNVGSSAAVTGTLLAAQFPALIGDLTTTAGSLTTTLATVLSGTGTFAGITFNAKGLATGTSTTANFGQVTVGSPTGGALGTGSLNAQSLYVNDVAVLTSNQTITLSGNVTGSGTTSITTTIGSNVVTYAMLQQIAGLSVIGNSGSSTANASAITGTANQVLVVNSGGTSLGFGQLNIGSSAAVTGVLLAAQHPALSGDVTSTAGSLATTISANAVTYAKFQQVAALSVVGNSGSSTANASAISGTASQILAVNSGGTTLAFVAPSTYSLSQWAAPTGNIALGGYTFTTTLTSFSTGQLVTYDYVNSVAQGLAIKAECAAASTANLTLSGTQTIDGYSANAGDRILVKNQTTSSQNGIYVVASGSWSRSSDANAWTDLPGAFVFILNGTTNGLTGWVCTVATGGTIGTTAVTFAQFSGAGTYTAAANGGLTLTGVAFSANVDNATLWINASNNLAVRSSTTANQVLLSQGSGPTSASWGALPLGNSNAVTGTLLAAQFPALTGDVTTTAGSLTTTIGSNAVTYAKFQQISGLAVIGNPNSSSGNATSIAGLANQVLVVNSAGTSMGFGQINLSASAAVTGTLLAAQFPALTGDVTNTGGSLATTISANAVTYAKFQQVAGLSLVGNAGSSTANAAAITGTANQVLVVNSGGTSLGFGQVNLSASAAVTGTLAAANGGTGSGTQTTNGVVYYNGTSLTTGTSLVWTGQLFSINSVPVLGPASIIGHSLGVENSAYNLIRSSTDMTASPWSTSSATVTSSTVAAPDGGIYPPQTVTDTSSSVEGYVRTPTQTITADTTVYTASIYVHSSSTTPQCNFLMTFSGGTTLNSGITLNLPTGTFAPSSTTGTAYGVQVTPDGQGGYWYRMYVTIANNGTNNGYHLTFFPASDSLSDTSYAIVWGPQFEVAYSSTSAPTSYIPNTSSSSNSLTRPFGSSFVQTTNTSAIAFLSSTATAPTNGFFLSSSTTLSSYVGGSQVYSLDSGGINIITDGSASSPSISLGSATSTTGLYGVLGTSLSFAVGGVNAATMTTASLTAPSLVPSGSALPSGLGLYAPSTTQLGFATSGSQAGYFGNGLVVGSPTGGDKGLGTVNATNVYVNGSAVLVGNQSITLTGNVTGSGTTSIATTIAANAVTYSMLQQVAGLSLVGNAGSSTANAAAITGTANQVLVVNSGGTALGFGQLNIGSSSAVTGTLLAAQFPALTGDLTTTAGSFATTISANAVTYAKFQQVAALSVVGNSGSSTANTAAITGTANQVLVVNSGGNALSFGQVNLASSSAVTGVLGLANGGTASSSWTANQLVFVNSGGSALTGNASLTWNGTTLSSTSVTVTGSTVPANGIYLSGTNTVGLSTNSTAAAALTTSSLSLLGGGSATAPGLALGSLTSTTGVYATSGTSMGLAIAGSSVLSMTTSAMTVPLASGFTSTTWPTAAAGSLGLTGAATFSSFGANNEATVFVSSINGLSLAGKGSTYDVSLLSSIGQVALGVNTGTRVVYIQDYPLVGSGTLYSQYLGVEPSAYNILHYTVDLTNSVWTTSNATVTSSTVAAPDGGIYPPQTVTDTSSSAFGSVRNATQTINADTTSYTLSIYVHSSSTTPQCNLLVTFTGGTTLNSSVTMNLTTLTVSYGSTAPAAFDYQTIPDGIGGYWYRIWLTVANNGTNNGFHITFSPASDVVSDTSYAIVWGPQCEVAKSTTSPPTSYIPNLSTSANSVTRAAGTSLIPNINAEKLSLPLAVSAQTTNGTVWNDSTQNSLSYYQMGIVEYLSGVLWRASASLTSTSATTAQTLLSTTAIGTLTLPANFLVVGKGVRITLSGIMTTAASPGTLTITLALGGTTIATFSGVTLTASLTNTWFEIRAEITGYTAGSSGTVVAAGRMLYALATTNPAATEVVPIKATSATTINTTTTQAITLQQTNGTASGVLFTVYNACVETLG